MENHLKWLKIRNQNGLQRICKSTNAAKNQNLLNFINAL